MIQTMDEYREPSIGERFGNAFSKVSGEVSRGIPQLMGEKINQKKENEFLKNFTGHDTEGLSDELKKVFLTNTMKKKEEKRNLSDTFTPLLNEMKSYRDYAGPIASKFDSINPYSAGAAKRSKINTLRLSLEGLFRDLTLKGQFPKAIYERILQNLPNASDAPRQYDEKISAIEDILEAQLSESQKENRENKSNLSSGKEPMVKVKAPDGKVYHVPKDKVKSAMEVGGKVIR